MNPGVVRRLWIVAVVVIVALSAPGIAAQSAVGNQMNADERADHAPNELGLIPIMQYHVITTDPEEEGQYTRTVEDFRADMQWLYDNDFYVIPMADFVRDTISAPPGKHPVVLTFDDSTPGQFRLLEQDDGSLLVDPNSAIGILEEFFHRYPDFGRGGFFAILPFNCFAGSIEPDQMQYCNRKLEWMVQNGYEIGNHTMEHQDLLDISDDAFAYQVGAAWQWIEENVPAEGAMPSMLVMPYGNYPSRETRQSQRQMMNEGIPYEGELYQLEAAYLVGAEPSPSPSSAGFDPIWIPRIQAFDEELERWLPLMENGSVILYTSDGDPNTVSVPDPLPAGLDGALDPELIAAKGKTLVQYDPSTGEPTNNAAVADTHNAWRRTPAIPAA